MDEISTLNLAPRYGETLSPLKLPPLNSVASKRDPHTMRQDQIPNRQILTGMESERGANSCQGVSIPGEHQRQQGLVHQARKQVG